MRGKSIKRREAIIEAATALFHQSGYERTSMDAISARLGGSKQTLYSYFRSKEDLFSAAMVAAMEERGHKLLELLDPDTKDLTATLKRFGLAYLDFITSPEIVLGNRVAISAASADDLGAQLYRMGPRRLWDEVESYLQDCIDRGQLDARSAAIPALHLQGLLEAGFAEGSLFGAIPLVNKKEAVTSAVNVFLKAYAA